MDSSEMNKTLLRNATALTVLALILEFLVLPYGYFFVFPWVQGANYPVGLVLLSLPRLVTVVVLLGVMRFLGGMPIAISTGLYSTVLVFKFFLSETYIQSGNLYALGTALVPYVVGVVTLLIGSVLLWRSPIRRAS